MMKKTILVVHNHYQTYGGEDSVFEHEVKMLREYGNTVITYERDNNEIKKYNIFKKLFLLFTNIYSFKTVKEIKKIIKENKIDIIHVHNTLPLISPSIYYVAKKNNIPVVQTVHNFRLLCPNGLLYREGKICEECINKGLNCALKHSCYKNSKMQTLASVISMKIHRKTKIYKYLNYICLTNFNKEILLKQGQIKESKVFVKPNYIEVTDSKYIPYKDRKDQFVYAGRLDESKGIKELFSAFKNTDKTLLVYGDGPLNNWCNKFINDNKLNNIKMQGFKEKSVFLKEISYSKALIVPSKWYEGAIPLTELEAYSCNTPVIGRKLGNVANGIIDKLSGFTFKDEKELISIINNIDLYPQIYETNYKNIINDSLKENNYKKLVSIYNTILKNKGE